ncbi:S53 family peptidase [Dictyobacter arantiisoli]|uniref:Kumamolisin n=1 Tax=Dictyobacter arantiisoli TaxID=2014874 RepID=A0A5A5TDH0_9CHLR|nr:S53 family peptidase [Dictyobacter arantiisoli]GCF08904.1 kumamolisin [Dictyobacter arantiisoli]
MANLPPRGFIRLAGSERQAPTNARAIGPVDPEEQLEVSVYLRDPAAISGEDDVSQEHARQPGPRMSRSAYAATHSASPDDVAQVLAFANQHHLTVVSSDPVARQIILSGSSADMTQAFAVDLHRYAAENTAGDETFRGRTGHIHIPAALEQIITGVFGLDDRPQAHPRFRFLPLGIKFPHVNTQVTTFTPLQLAGLYDFPAGLDGSGQCIGIIELGGGYQDSDLATYFQQLGLSSPQVVSVGVDGATNSPVGDPSSADGEVVLDIEVAGSIAPKARIAVYFAPNTDRGFLDAITQAIHDTQNSPSVISISWGGPESNWTAQAMQSMDQAFQAATTLGITICSASGDNGSSDGITDNQAHVDFPASSPNVLACGGTRLEASQNQVASEVVWNESATGNGASGGGISDTFDLPSWQAQAKVPTSSNSSQRRGRGVPDVAGDADPQTGYQIYVDGQGMAIGGTSAVSPLWAGLIALLNQKRGQPVGFFNPFLYQNYQRLLQAKALRDITSGNNGSYSAGSGWDACTGLGTPDGARLLEVLTTATTTSISNAAD